VNRLTHAVKIQAHAIRYFDFRFRLPRVGMAVCRS
jgi:hypothetical protein